MFYLFWRSFYIWGTLEIMLVCCMLCRIKITFFLYYILFIINYRPYWYRPNCYGAETTWRSLHIDSSRHILLYSSVQYLNKFRLLPRTFIGEDISLQICFDGIFYRNRFILKSPITIFILWDDDTSNYLLKLMTRPITCSHL